MSITQEVCKIIFIIVMLNYENHKLVNWEKDVGDWMGASVSRVGRTAEDQTFTVYHRKSYRKQLSVTNFSINSQSAINY